MKHYLLLLLLCCCPGRVAAQAKIRDFYCVRPKDLVAKELRIFYLQRSTRAADTSTDSTLVRTITSSVTSTVAPNGVSSRSPQTVTVTTERKRITTKPQDPVTHYDAIQARIRNPIGVKFRVRQEKDTLYLTPLHFSQDEWASPALNGNVIHSSEEVKHSVNATNAGTYFIKLSKKPNEAGLPTPLHPITWNFGVLTVPARLYLGTGGDRSQVNLVSGAAAYVSKSTGYRKFYSDGTSSYAAVEPLFFLGATMLSPNSDSPKASTATVPAVSFGFGFLLGNSDLKTGLVAGYDVAVTKDGNASDYNHPIFLGLVLSLAITPFTNAGQ